MLLVCLLGVADGGPIVRQNIKTLSIIYSFRLPLVLTKSFTVREPVFIKKKGGGQKYNAI